MQRGVVVRVIDVQCDIDNENCYVYCRDEKRNRYIVTLRSVYKVAIGMENGDRSATAMRLLCDTTCEHVHGAEYARHHMNANNVHRVGSDNMSMHNIDVCNVDIRNVGEIDTYYRGRKYAMEFACNSYRSMKTILDKVKYKYNKDLFVCCGYSTVEDITLFHHGIYGALYVCICDGKVTPADKTLHFSYEPIVASFDLEMMSLDATSVDSEPYTASYIVNNKIYAIYSSTYIQCSEMHDSGARSNDERNNETYDDIVYMCVETNMDVVRQLCKLINDTDPDVVVGYNIYNADIPIVYFALRRKLEQWPKVSVGPPPYFHATKRLDKKYVDSEAGVAIKIPGVHFVDMYVYLSRMLPPDEQGNLKLDAVGTKYLGTPKDPFTYRDLARIHTSGTQQQKMDVIRYCCKDSQITLSLYKHFNVWHYHSDIYSKCGIDAQRYMSKGIVETSYGLLSAASFERNVYIDASNKRIFKPSGGLVIEPVSGYHENVHIIDLSSLYPNIVIQHCIDARTLLPRNARFDDLVHSGYYMTNGNVDILHDNFGGRHAFAHNTDAMMPKILKGLLDLRADVKKRIAVAKSNNERNELLRLTAEELATKTLANGYCGALAEQSDGNPVSFCLLDDIITTTGRSILKLSQNIIRSCGAQLVYGDTDSLMVKYDHDINVLLDRLHAQLPERIRFKVEYVADRFVMGKKKHYVARVNGKVRISGFKAAKSSACKMVRNVFSYVVTLCMEEGPKAAIDEYNKVIDDCTRDTTLLVEDFSTKMSYRGKEYSTTSYQGGVIRCMKQRGVEMVPGNYMDVVTVKSNEEYVATYKRRPQVALPSHRTKKYERTYTVDEVASDVRCVDVRETFRTQCTGPINSIVEMYQSQ